MRKLAEFFTDNLSYVLFIVAAGWAAAFAVWATDHQNLLESFLLTNRLPPELRTNLLVSVVVGVLLALLLWVGLGLLAVALRRPVGLVVRRGATLALPVTLLAIWPILSVENLAAESPFLIFFLVAVMAGIAFVTVNRASDLFGPLPSWARRLATLRSSATARACPER